MKKNIAVLLDNIPSDGGTYQYNLTILDAFIKLPIDKFDKKILYTNHHWGNKLKNTPFQKKYVRISDLQKKVFKLIASFGFNKHVRYIFLSIFSRNIDKSLNDKEIDLIILPSQDVISLYIKTAKVNAIHDLMHRYESHFPEVSRFFQSKYRDILFSSFCKESVAILVDSNVGKDQVNETYEIEKKRIFVLPFIPPSYIVDKIQINKDFKSLHFDWPEDYIIYPAQFWKHKNHENLLKAISILKNSGININLVLTGKKTYEYNNLIIIIKELNIEENVFFVNFIPEDYLKIVYSKSKGLVMPTFFGPTNIPPLEAVFSGCPVAVSNIYGMPEQLNDAALYFNPKKVEEIADALKILWTDESRCIELKKNGNKLMNNWNQDIFYKKFEMILIEVLTINTKFKVN
jgi:glycosyltransferase involved in cell wall biosynthesis